MLSHERIAKSKLAWILAVPLLLYLSLFTVSETEIELMSIGV